MDERRNWFAGVDIANPHAPREVASFLPPVPEGAKPVSSNDVFVDSRGPICLIDRTRGPHILERIRRKHRVSSEGRRMKYWERRHERR